MTTLERAAISVQLPIVLRLAVKEDLSKLEWYGQYTHFRNVFRRTYREQQQGRRVILVADSNNFPIGHIFILLKSARYTESEDDPRAYFYSLRVMEMFRGHGIGSRLVEEAEAIVRERGATWAMIAVAKHNHRARRLYERLGYQVVGDDDGQWSYTDHLGRIRFVTEPSWILEKRL